MVDGDLGVGLVYPLDERFQRLDLWLAGQDGGIPVADQLSILRQVAEVVQYAHANRVVHRCLTPHAVWVRRLDDSSVRAVVGDWQSSGATASVTRSAEAGVTGLLGAGERTGPPGGHPGGLSMPVIGDVDLRLAEAFQAPEGVWAPAADRIRLDVFALGALAYFMLAGQPAARDRASLRERLRRDHGLDLAADLPQVAADTRLLVLEATRPAVTERLADVRAFLARLNDAEKVLTAPDEDVTDILEAAPGAVIDGRYRLERRLGAGSTAVGLLMTDLDAGTEGPDSVRVLKVALDDAAAARLESEAEVLAALRDPRLVRLIAGPVRIGGRTALVLESPARRPWPKCCGSVSGSPSTCRNAGGPTCLRRWSCSTGPAWTTATSSRPTSVSGKAAATVPSTWSCSTSRCPARARPRLPRARRPT